MKRQHSAPVIVFALLVMLGVVGRFAFLDVPNFSPTAALAVFAGFYFSRRSVAVLVPIAVMAITNIWLDAYLSTGEMAIVYAAFVFPALLSHGLRKDSPKGRRLRTGGFIACSTAPSLVFFVTTNFAVWLFGGLYETTAMGLAQCYVQAIPFYGYTLAGDLIFTSLVFLAYYRVFAVMATSRMRSAVAS